MRNYDYELLVDIFAGRKLYDNEPIMISESDAANAVLEGIRRRKTLNESRSILSYIKSCQITAENKDVELSQVVDEGILSGILGGFTGAAFGPKLGEALCKALGIEKGMLYNLLTSRMFLGALGGFLGAKL